MFIHPPIARSRSFTKAVTWRVVGSLDTTILGFLMPWAFGLSMGKSAKVALSIAAVESVTKIALFYAHERAWARVPWGRADKVVEELEAETATDGTSAPASGASDGSSAPTSAAAGGTKAPPAAA